MIARVPGGSDRPHALEVRTKPTVYLIEPDPAERDRIVADLATHAKAVIAFARGRDFLEHGDLAESPCVVVELELPDMRAVDVVTAVGRIVPVIVLGRVDDLSVAVEMMRAGAADFLDRPCDKRRLRAAVRAATSARVPTGR